LPKFLQYLTAEAGPRVALDYREQFRAFNRLLSDYPDIWPLRARLGRTIRIGRVSPYLVIYRRDNEAVIVLRVVHGRRRITEAMLKPR
jgi:plasmid stabilization system protein ParE